MLPLKLKKDMEDLKPGFSPERDSYSCSGYGGSSSLEACGQASTRNPHRATEEARDEEEDSQEDSKEIEGIMKKLVRETIEAVEGIAAVAAQSDLIVGGTRSMLVSRPCPGLVWIGGH